MSATKFFELSNEELNNKLDELKAELFNLRFKHAIKQLSNPMVLVTCKRDIARVKTIIRQRQLGISEQVVKSTARKKAAK